MNCFRIVAFSLLLLSFPRVSSAHFLWLVRVENKVHLYFSETASEGEPELLARFEGQAIHRLTLNARAAQGKLSKDGDSLCMPLPASQTGDAVFTLQNSYGVIERGGESFLLKYYAKTGPSLVSKLWTTVDNSPLQPLDVSGRPTANGLEVQVLWKGKPAPDVQVVASAEGGDEVEVETDKRGVVAIPGDPYRSYSIRARFIESVGGELNGKPYSAIRHYSTLALPAASPSGRNKSKTRPRRIAPPPEAVTSFGAAIIDHSLYLYGGHKGDPHEYYRGAQASSLQRLRFQKPLAWEKVADGPPLQGLALVAAGSKLFRIGGFTAKNKEDEEQELWSQAGVASYDVRTGEGWRQMPALPEPRSSFDAAVLGGTIYVMGGWRLGGDADPVWYSSAYALDTTQENAQWRSLPKAPFKRRALALAAYAGRIYAIGGMQEKGGPSTSVDIYDPKTKRWTNGPNIRGDGMQGFGCSAFATGGNLYVTTVDGSLQRLAKNDKSWEEVGQLETGRFFHRMLPYSPHQLLIIGGTNMTDGKQERVEIIELRSDDKNSKVSAESSE